MLKKFGKLVLVSLFGLTIVQASGHMVSCTEGIMSRAWKVRGLSEKMMTSKEARAEYTSEFSTYIKESHQCARDLVSTNQWEDFSEFYKSLDDINKQALDFVVKGLIREMFHNNKSDSNFKAEEYFPGYGYATPGYQYRKGKELKREFLYAYWVDEEIEEETSESKEYTFEAKLYAKLKVDLGPAMELIGSANVDIGGELTYVKKVKMSKSYKIKMKQKRKFGYDRVYVELYEAKKGSSKWKLVGKTFQFDRWPTGEQVVFDAQVE